MTTSGPKQLFRRRRHPRLLVMVVALAMAGIAAIAIWFMSRSVGSESETAASPSVSISPSPSVGKPKIKGVVVQVLNGTTRHQLAATTSDELATLGYDVKEPANSKTPRSQTLIEYRPKYLADALFLKRVYFPRAVLRTSSTGLPSGVAIKVILGNDAPG
jgi:hypothetical protein